MPGKLIDAEVEVYLDEWDTEELVKEIRDRGDSIYPSNFINNLYLSFCKKDIEKVMEAVSQILNDEGKSV